MATPNVATARSQIADLSTVLSSLSHDLAEKDRQQLLAALRSLVQQVETSRERVARMMWHEPLILTSTRVLMDLRIFNILTEVNEPITAAQLCIPARADQTLVERLLKHVATEGFVTETGHDTYMVNDVTRTLARSDAEGCVRDMFQMLKVYHRLPEYLDRTAYMCPNDKDASPWTFAYDTKLHYFDWVQQDPERIKALQGHMEFKNSVGLQWYEDSELVEAALGTGAGADDVLLVDVGGSAGHQLLGFRKKYPEMPGRLILQDLPAVVDNANTQALAEAGIKAMGSNSFETQAVQGAKAYYLKMVLHDWPDDQCLVILRGLAPALRKGYSKILINEIVVPYQGAEWFQTSVDMLMLSCHAARERREREWRSLIGRVGGLMVSRIWNVAGAVEKIIEIEAVGG